MFKIKNAGDLKRFKKSGSFSQPYCQYVEEYFWQLVTSLTPPDSDPSNYDLADDGYIVALQESDNPRNLKEVGLPEGLMVSFPGPEFVEKEVLPDGTLLFRAVFLYSNDYIMTFFFSNIWEMDKGFISWLEEETLSDFSLEGEIG